MLGPSFTFVFKTVFDFFRTKNNLKYISQTYDKKQFSKNLFKKQVVF